MCPSHSCKPWLIGIISLVLTRRSFLIELIMMIYSHSWLTRSMTRSRGSLTVVWWRSQMSRSNSTISMRKSLRRRRMKSRTKLTREMPLSRLTRYFVMREQTSSKWKKKLRLSSASNTSLSPMETWSRSSARLCLNCRSTSTWLTSVIAKLKITKERCSRQNWTQLPTICCFPSKSDSLSKWWLLSPSVKSLIAFTVALIARLAA